MVYLLAALASRAALFGFSFLLSRLILLRLIIVLVLGLRLKLKLRLWLRLGLRSRSRSRSWSAHLSVVAARKELIGELARHFSNAVVERHVAMLEANYASALLEHVVLSYIFDFHNLSPVAFSEYNTAHLAAQCFQRQRRAA